MRFPSLPDVPHRVEFEQRLKPMPFEQLQCSEANATCLAALTMVSDFAGGTVGRRNATFDGGSEVNAYGIGPVPDNCPPTLRTTYYPCVSAPFSAVTYRGSCGLNVHAGCGIRDATNGVWTSVGCEMRGGGRIRFDAGGDADPRLAGEWIVGNSRSPDDAGNSFWVYRADGEPHGFAVDEAAAAQQQQPSNDSLGRRSRSGQFRCVLTTMPKPGDACCYNSYTYPTCTANATETIRHGADAAGDARLWRPLAVAFGGALACAVVLLCAVVTLCRKRSRRMLQAARPPLLPQPAPKSDDPPSAAEPHAVVGTSDEHGGGGAAAVGGGAGCGDVTGDGPLWLPRGFESGPLEVMVDLRGGGGATVAPLPAWDVMYVRPEAMAEAAEQVEVRGMQSDEQEQGHRHDARGSL